MGGKIWWKNKWLLILAVLALMVGGKEVFPEDAGRVMLDVTTGEGYVASDNSGLKTSNAVVDVVWITVNFLDPSMAHAVVAIVEKDGEEVEVNLALEGRYSRGSTKAFKGVPVVGKWRVRIKGEILQNVGIYLTIDCVTAPTSPPQVVSQPSGTPTVAVPVLTPTAPSVPTTATAPGSRGGEPAITPEIQFQALTRILMRKGIITPTELAEEIQKVSRERGR